MQFRQGTAVLSAQLGNCCGRREPAVFEPQYPRAAGRKIEIVCDKKRGEVVSLMEPFNERKDLTGRGLIQIAGWFVGEQEARIVDEGASKSYTLLLATG